MSGQHRFESVAVAGVAVVQDARCRGARRSADGCNVVGTPGKHEFDEGTDELLRLVYAGDRAGGPFLRPRWRGALFPYVSSTWSARQAARCCIRT